MEQSDADGGRLLGPLLVDTPRAKCNTSLAAWMTSDHGTPVTGCEEAPSMDPLQGSISEMWWSLVQDQVGALNREIESLRLANAQVQARFAEILTQQTEATESSKSMALFVQELHWVQTDLKAEREERRNEMIKTKEGMREEFKRQTESLAEQLQSETLSKEICSLKQMLELEKTSRCEAHQALTEHTQKLVGEAKTGHENHAAEFGLLQSRVEVIGKDLEGEAKRWSNSLGKIFQHMSDQEQRAKEERQLLERQKESDKEELRQLVAESCAKGMELTRMAIDGARQIVNSDSAIRQKMEASLKAEREAWHAIKVDASNVPRGSSRPPLREPLYSAKFLAPVSDMKADLSARSVSSSFSRSRPASSRGNSPVRMASLQPSVAPPSQSRGTSPVRSQTTGQAVKLFTYRSPSAGLCSVVSNADLLSSAGSSSAATLRPSHDILSTCSDSRGMLQSPIF